MQPARRLASHCSRTLSAICLGAFAFPIALHAQTDVWNVGGLSPAPRCEHSLVWDTRNQRLVLFGGLLFNSASNVFSNETWAMVGDVWRYVPPQGVTQPEPRLDHAAAYDSNRRKMVVYGGQVRTDGGWFATADTWEWNGLTWQRFSNSAPGPRVYHAMAFDSARGVCVLFGGLNQAEGGARYGDTWEWTGDSWTLRAKSAPSSRYWHAMTYDVDRAVTVLHGGRAAGQTLSDTWEWDGTQWTSRGATPILARYGHTLAYDAARRVTVLDGGEGQQPGPSTWQWDGQTWRAAVGESAYFAMFGAAAYDASRRAIVSTAGAQSNLSGSSMLRDSIRFVGHSWRQVTSGAPHANPPVYDPERGVTLSLVSDPRTVSATSHTQVWDGLVWSTLDVASPPPRSDAALAFDTVRRRVLLVGGLANSTLSIGDVWDWDGARWRHLSTSTMTQRAHHAMAFDANRGINVVFGGWRFGAGYLGDTIEFDGLMWRSVAATGPAPRSRAASAYDPIRRVVVLYGGQVYGSAGWLGDTWAWNGASWSQWSTSGPHASNPRMTFDTQRGRLVMFQSATPTAPMAAWEWDGAGWASRALPTASVPPNSNGTVLSPAPLAGITYDTARSRLVAVHSTGVVYELGPAAQPPAISRQPEPLARPERRDAAFAVEVVGSTPLRYRWRHNGVDLADGPTGHGSVITGSRDKSLAIFSIRPADEGTYQCLVQNLAGDAVSTGVTLDVLCYTDCDGTSHPPVLGATDYICFMNRYAAGDPYANCDDSATPPVLNVADYVCFLSRLAVGCQ